MNWLAKRRFNIIDAAAVCTLIGYGRDGHLLLGFIIWFILLLFSVVAEAYASKANA
jgi:hypothetical protein